MTTPVDVSQDGMERDARQTKTNADKTPATGEYVRMGCGCPN